MSDEINALIAQRDKLAAVYDKRGDECREAREAMYVAKEEILDFDKENPGVMRVVNAARGEVKKRRHAEALAAAGEDVPADVGVVSAHGAADVASPEGEGG